MKERQRRLADRADGGVHAWGAVEKCHSLLLLLLLFLLFISSSFRT